jgi:hypothetical protein
MKTSANSIAKSSAYYESSITELGKVFAALEGTLGEAQAKFQGGTPLTQGASSTAAMHASAVL